MIDHGHWTRVSGRPPWNTNRHSTTQQPNTVANNDNILDHNPYHVLSDEDNCNLRKLTLPDGSIVFSEYTSIQKLYEKLKSVFNGFGGKLENGKMDKLAQHSDRNQNIPTFNEAKIALITKVREHTIKAKTKKRNKKKNKTDKNQKGARADETTIEFQQIIQEKASAGTQLTILKSSYKTKGIVQGNKDKKHTLQIST